MAISGAGGGVGALGVQFARAMGYRVIAIDLGVSKREYCLELGAEVYFDAKEVACLCQNLATRSASQVSSTPGHLEEHSHHRIRGGHKEGYLGRHRICQARCGNASSPDGQPR
jgi:D-arabinose 1-dehydrogenase-like Zn-dependent alcohol dehydrogenase